MTSVPLARRAGGPDLARGISLLGIAMANMVGWLHGREWTVLLKQREGTALDRLVDVLIALLADNRGFPLFAMLFGYGIGVLWRRSRERGESTRQFIGRMGRRHVVLLAIGLAHAILLFSGDILVAYAIIGMFVVLLVSRHRIALPAAGLVALPALGVWGWVDGTIGLTGQSGYPAASAATYLASLEIRADGALRGLALTVLTDAALLAPMAIGAIAARIRLLEQVGVNRDLLVPLARWGLLVGLVGAMPLTAVLVLDPAHLHLDSAPVLGVLGIVHQYSGLVGALGIAAAAALVAERVRLGGTMAEDGAPRQGVPARLAGAAVRGIEALGALSLSVYLAQSALYLALFPPYTLDLGARLGSAGTAGIVLLGWLVMIPLAVALHRHGRRGPFEVILRVLAGSSVASPRGTRHAAAVAATRPAAISPAITSPAITSRHHEPRHHEPHHRHCSEEVPPMTVFADTPRWPRHGMLWGHLISDTSLEELHETAARAGLPPRSFDLDHYDWPTAAHDALAAAGVQFVADGELTRILIASGLRVRLRDRAAARARRSAEHAAQLGLDPVPRDLIVGMIGHVDPLPEGPGAFRMTRDHPEAPPRIQSHDEAGRVAAKSLLARLDALSRDRTGSGFVGQVMDAPEG